MMNTTSSRLANYRAAQAALAASVRYAKYDVMNGGVRLAQVSFPNDVLNANFYDVCFYDPATDTFRGDTVVGQYTLKRVG